MIGKQFTMLIDLQLALYKCLFWSRVIFLLVWFGLIMLLKHADETYGEMLHLEKQMRFIHQSKPLFNHEYYGSPLQWHNNECDGVSNHRHLDGLLNHLFRHRSKKTSKLRVTGLCEGNSPVIGEFPSQRASNMEMFPFDNIIMILTVQKQYNSIVCLAYQMCKSDITP